MAQKDLFNSKVRSLDSLKKKLTGEETKPLISSSPSITVKEALQLMARSDILCLPIQSHSNPNNIVNLVNLFDILNYIVQTVNSSQSATPIRANKEDAVYLTPECYQRLVTPIESVMSLDSSRESYRMVKCHLDDDLSKIIRTFSNGIHRAIIIDENEKPNFIITQMDIIRHLNAHRELLPSTIDGNKTIKELGLVAGKVLIVEDDISAIEAYKLMAENQFTSIVVVERKTGKILSNLSASSLRGLSTSNLENILDPVQRFLQESPRGIRPLVFGRSDLTFWETVDKLVTNNAHHLWLVDEDEKPNGTISPTDIFKLLVKSTNA